MSWAVSRTIPSGLLALLLSFEASGAESVDVGNRWGLFSDRVMGGVSDGAVEKSDVGGKSCLRMVGDVRLENNGGFIQIASALNTDDRQAFAEGDGVELEVYGNDEEYNVHLRTDAMRRPWQSYRAIFTATPSWQTIRLPFTAFEPYRIDGPLTSATVRRIGIVAIGREFTADLCIARVAVYRD